MDRYSVFLGDVGGCSDRYCAAYDRPYSTEELFDRVASIGVSRMVTYGNGDQAQYIDHTFACTYLGGDPRPADGENTDVRWFPVGELPDMRPHMLDRVEAGLAHEERARIVTTTESL